MKQTALIAVLGFALPAGLLFAASGRELRVGSGFHAFDHLGNIDEQADAAAAAGVNIIYATGLGGVGYGGLPPETEMATSVAPSRPTTKTRGATESASFLAISARRPSRKCGGWRIDIPNVPCFGLPRA